LIFSRPFSAGIGLDNLDTGSDHRPIFLELYAVGLSVREPFVPRVPRQVIDRETVKSADWLEYAAGTEDIPLAVTRLFDLLPASEDLPLALSAAWRALESFLAGVARCTLPFRSVGASTSRPPLNGDSKAIRLISGFLRARGEYAGHEAMVTETLYRLKQLLGDEAAHLGITSPANVSW
jgi:hypothetical protein